MRQELSQELLNNRRELQAGLSLTTQVLEKKLATLDDKLEKKMGEFSLGVQNKLEANIKEGFFHFEKVQEHLKGAQLQLLNLNQVGESINELNNLLKMPHLRGGFGEAVLEKLLSDLLPSHAFELQYKITPHSTERVDAVVKFPTNVLPIDSKFPREQILPLFETNSPESLEKARKNLAEVLRIQAKQIKEKYIHPEHGTTDMAFLFVPSETLYFEVLKNQKLCDEMNRLRVIIVSPNTLAISLQAISVARQYYEMAKGVEKTVLEIKKVRQHFDHFQTRFEDIGISIGKAQTAFDTASTHLSRYVSATSRLESHESLEVLSKGSKGSEEPVVSQ
jgi:DNA recombination protein RmuC